MTPIERAGYIAHSMSRGYQRKLDKAKALIASHPDYLVSTSWGKDSITLLHMAAQIHSDLVAVNGRYPNPNERLPEADRVRDEALSRNDMAHIDYNEVIVVGAWEAYKRAGEAFHIPTTQAQKESLKWLEDDFQQKLGQAVVDHNRRGTFVGMRQEESHARRMNITMRGDDYTKKDGTSICLPLARWSGKDIWAYIVTNNLPYLKLYDESFVGRERARSEFIWGGKSADTAKRYGVWEDWRKVYPKEFNAWMAEFPELKRGLV